MDSAEIKIDLFRKLDTLSGADLKDAYGFLMKYMQSKNKNSDWENLTQEQKDAISIGIKQLDNGEGRSSSDVLADFRTKFLNV